MSVCFLNPGLYRGFFHLSFTRPVSNYNLAFVTTINLYQPNHVDETVDFPTEWNELTIDELHIIAKTILSGFDKSSQANAFLLQNLLVARCNGKIPSIDKRLDAEDAVINGFPLIEFILKENKLTRQPYPELKVPNRMIPCKPHRMVGPVDEFNNITCGEFEDAEVFFGQFNENPNPESLAFMAAVLYRKEGVPYISFNPKDNSYSTYDAEAMVRHFAKLKPWELYTIYLWYIGCRTLMSKIFPLTFSTGSGDGEADPFVFTKCIHASAGPKNGSRNEIRRTLLKEFLMELELESKNQEELKRQMDAAK